MPCPRPRTFLCQTITILVVLCFLGNLGVLMQKPGSQVESSILRLAPFEFGSTESHEVPLRFVEHRGQPHVLYSGARPPEWISWATNALVRWRIGTKTFVGNASPIDDQAALQEILPEYAQQFVMVSLSRWFGPDVGCIALTESMSEPSYYDTVEALFDQAARHYDRMVQDDPLNMHPRQVSSEVLSDLFPSGSHVLELGCGTGLETIPLAEAGVNVVAVYISARMLEELDRKARTTSLGKLIVTRKGAISQLSAILSDFGPGSFDGAFSHFGAINCEPNLAGLPETLHRLIKADGRISLGILNRTSLAEILLFTARLRPKRAFARFRSGPVGLSQFGVPVSLYSAQEVGRLFSPFFAGEKPIGVSVLLPPSYLGRRLMRHPGLLSLLESMEGSVARRPLFRHLGDYLLIQMIRRQHLTPVVRSGIHLGSSPNGPGWGPGLRGGLGVHV